MIDDLNITLTKDELKILKYMLKSTSNKECLFEQLSEDLAAKIKLILSPVELKLKDIHSLQDAANHLSYLDENPGTHWKDDKITKFLKEISEENPDLFVDLANFVFSSAKSRKLKPSSKTYFSFSSDTRERVADICVESGLYVEKIIKHYFRLLAQNGSWNQRKRIKKWLEDEEVSSNKLLMTILVASKRTDVAIFAIETIDKKSLPLLVSDVKHPYAKWYLEKKLSNSSFPEGISVTLQYGKDKNGVPRTRTITGRSATKDLYKKETGQDPWKRI